MPQSRRLVAVLALSFTALAGFPAAGGATSLELVSHGDPAFVSDTGGGPSLAVALASSWSDDGRYSIFVSAAPNLLPGQVDNNGNFDVFLYDRVGNALTLVSRASSSPVKAGDNAVFGDPVISGDGRFVAFSSYASDLVPGQGAPFQRPNVFLYDRTTGAMVLVSHSTAGATAPANERSALPRVSADGAVVAFVSRATDLVPGQVDTNGGGEDVFVYRRSDGSITLASRAAGAPTTTGNAGCTDDSLAISADGRYVAFACRATNLVAGQADTNDGEDLFLFDTATGTTTLVSRAAGAAGNTTAAGFSKSPFLSTDGRLLAFASSAPNLVGGQADANSDQDVFVYDRTTGALSLESRATASATQTGAAGSFLSGTSADGRFLVFTSSAADLVAGGDPGGHPQVFLRDRSAGATFLISRSAPSPGLGGNGESGFGLVSDDGRYVAFTSLASDLVAGQSDPETGNDVFLFDRTAGTARLISRTGASATAAAGEFSGRPALSRDGRFTVWSSRAVTLTPEVDSNLIDDVFLFDRTSGVNKLVSRRALELPSFAAQFGGLLASSPDLPAASGSPVSADGRFVVFVSADPHVVPGQVNPVPFFGRRAAGPAVDKHGEADEGNIFLYDRLTRQTVLVSHQAGSAITAAEDPSRHPRISADGRFVVFASDAHDLVEDHEDPEEVHTSQVFLFDRTSGENVRVSRTAGLPTHGGNGESGEPIVSSDGRFVVYASAATDLVSGFVDGNGDEEDLFLFDRVTGQTALVSHAASSPTASGDGGSREPAFSADGRFVAFTSEAADLAAGISDGNGDPDIYLYDRQSGAITLLSGSPDFPTSGTFPGASTQPVLSADGRYVAFLSLAFSPPEAGEQVYLLDRQSNTLARASHPTFAFVGYGDGPSSHPSLSADGKWLAFASEAPDIVPNPPSSPGNQVFVYDRDTGVNRVVSHWPPDEHHAANAPSTNPSISADGRYVAFESRATDLIAGQVDVPVVPTGDIFVWDRLTGANRLVSHRTGVPSAAASGESTLPAISADGTSIAFNSFAQDLLAGDRNLTSDVYLERRDSHPGKYFAVSPCRLRDSRDAATPLANGAPQVWPFYALCGIPSTATAVSLNLTVVAGDGAGFLTVFPGDQAPALTTSTLNFRAGQIRANNAVARLASDGSGTLGLAVSATGSGQVHVIVDVNGYFE